MLESVKNRAAAFFSEEPFLTVLKLTVVFGSESGTLPDLPLSLSSSLWWRVQSKPKENMLRKRKVGKQYKGDRNPLLVCHKECIYCMCLGPVPKRISLYKMYSHPLKND